MFTLLQHVDTTSQLGAIKPIQQCKGKLMYLLTWKVSRYSGLPLQFRVGTRWPYGEDQDTRTPGSHLSLLQAWVEYWPWGWTCRSVQSFFLQICRIRVCAGRLATDKRTRQSVIIDVTEIEQIRNGTLHVSTNRLSSVIDERLHIEENKEQLGFAQRITSCYFNP